MFLVRGGAWRRRELRIGVQAEDQGSRRRDAPFLALSLQNAGEAMLSVRARIERRWSREGTYRYRTVAAIAVSVMVLLPAGRVHAQQLQQGSLSDVLSFLLTNQSVPTGDFVKDAAAAAATRDTVSRALLLELATLPIGSSSPGFVYRLNPDLGTQERATQTFGPFFAERSLTAGRKQVSFGLAMRHTSFTHLGGEDLRDGQFIISGNRFVDESRPFDVEALTLDLSARTMTGLFNVGVTDHLDIGAAVPIVSISLEGSRINTYRGQVLVQARADARSTGVGDVAIRGKYRFLDRPGVGGLAAVGEVRLPTGDADKLLGTGDTAVSALAIASFEQGRLGVDGNFGVVRGGAANEVQYRGAGSVAVAQKVTAVVELFGRRISDFGRIVAAEAPHPSFANVNTIRLVSEPGAQNTAAILGGVKWNPAGTWLFSASLSRNIGDPRLRSGVVAQAGLDYAWTR